MIKFSIETIVLEKLFEKMVLSQKGSKKMTYIIKGQNFIGKKNINQLRHQYIETVEKMKYQWKYCTMYSKVKPKCHWK